MKDVKKLLGIFPYIAILVLMNTLITFTISAVVMMQMTYLGYNKYLSLAIALVVAIATYCYIIFNHQIRNKIKETTT